MDEELLKLLDAFNAARSNVRNYIQRKENEASMMDIEEKKVLALAHLAADELNESTPDPEPVHTRGGRG
jgi:hypothetical protein